VARRLLRRAPWHVASCDVADPNLTMLGPKMHLYRKPVVMRAWFCLIFDPDDRSIHPGKGNLS